MDTFLSGVNVPTLHVNQNVLKGSGKFQRKQIISILQRSVKENSHKNKTKPTYCDLFLNIVCSGSNLKKGRNQLGYCLRHRQRLLLKVQFLQANINHQTVKVWQI